MIDKWDLRYLELAKEVARYSKDPSTKAGAVLVDPHGGQVGSGFNGFARGVEDLPERYDDRDLKLMMIVHSEVNAIVFSKRDLWGCTIYTWPFPPCSNCAAIIIQAGIFR
jgi:dCMP deaminase